MSFLLSKNSIKSLQPVEKPKSERLLSFKVWARTYSLTFWTSNRTGFWPVTQPSGQGSCVVTLPLNPNTHNSSSANELNSMQQFLFFKQKFSFPCDVITKTVTFTFHCHFQHQQWLHSPKIVIQKTGNIPNRKQPLNPGLLSDYLFNHAV